MAPSDMDIEAVIVDLLARRAPEATICPSDAARTLRPDGWRPLMPKVRDVTFAMAREGVLEIRQGGLAVDPDGPPPGPLRLARPTGP